MSGTMSDLIEHQSLNEPDGYRSHPHTPSLLPLDWINFCRTDQSTLRNAGQLAYRLE